MKQETLLVSLSSSFWLSTNFRFDIPEIYKSLLIGYFKLFTPRTRLTSTMEFVKYTDWIAARVVVYIDSFQPLNF